VFRRVFGIEPDPPGETPSQRLDRARSWLTNEIPNRRVQALSILNAMAPDEALESCFAAFSDPDDKVRTMAATVLVGQPRPAQYGGRIVTELGGEMAAAEWIVRMRQPVGYIGSFGLTERLLPCLDEIARGAERQRDRRTAARYADELRQHPPGWPMMDQPSPDHPGAQ
jgi:hypothetical protein